MTQWIVCLFSLFTVVQSVGVPTEFSDIEAREKAIATINNARSMTVDHKLYTTRIERIEGDFVERQVSVYNRHVAKGVFVYEVSVAGCDPRLDEKGNHECTLSVDADPRWYVVVSRETGEAYRLSGFDDSVNEFNRMATDLHFQISDDKNAGDYALSFISLLYGPESDFGLYTRLVRSRFQLKQIAEANFHCSYSESTYEMQFSSWWQKYDTTKSRSNFEPKVSKQGDDYQVLVHVLRTMPCQFKHQMKAPILEEITLTVSAKGQVQITKDSEMLPRKSP